MRSLEEPYEAVFQALKVEWHVLYDVIKSMEGLKEIIMCNPLKLRINSQSPGEER